jgi:hypothetical protein
MMSAVSKGDSALRYAYVLCFNRYCMLIGAESRHFLLRDFVVIHYENGNSKRKPEFLTEGNVSVAVVCVAVTHRENGMCVEVCGCGQTARGREQFLCKQTDNCSGAHLYVDTIT